METTSRLVLPYPDESDYETDYPPFAKAALEILDTALVLDEDTISDRPAPSVPGRVFRATDTKEWQLEDGAEWDTLLTLGRGALRTRSVAPAATVTANPGDLIVAGAGATINLPAAPPTDSMVGIIATSASPVSVLAAANIKGVGLNDTTFVLGVAGAAAILQYDGTSWRFLSGKPDTGWVNVTPGTHWAAGTRGALCRIVEDLVSLRGGLVATGSVTMSDGVVLATLPAAMAPPQIFRIPGTNLRITASSQLVYSTGSSINAGSGGSGGVTAGAVLDFDGIHYKVS